MRKLIVLSVIALLAVGCGNQTKIKTTDNDSANVAVLSVTDFMAKGEALVGKTVSVKGLVDHVCKHGGKKMMLVGDSATQRLKIKTGKDIAQFDVAFEGGEVVATGVVKMTKIDSAYLANWEKEIREDAEKMADSTKVADKDHDADKGHEHGVHGEKADMGNHTPGLDNVEKYRKQLIEQKKEYIPIFSVVADKVQKIENADK